ncbi:TPA: hypothetical protein N0F65_009749 [Lagenidium giganteum]|uniref:BED-type domain-containing protein n=1 Tax=Lagenidium giganteum TaxID=4803 RepID=A0AAV2YMU9_9STRA|nr:TPA: hypothetical protein N0F65_009749 [Lagenidium giganteum]
MENGPEPAVNAAASGVRTMAAALMDTIDPVLQQAMPSQVDLKKTGRPVHPLWAHFHRGEKRNRYHYHAFCVYCVARYGAAQVAPTRGVSTDMLRHLEKCASCPAKVLASLREVCGRRDAGRFDKFMKQTKSLDDSDLSTRDPTLLTTGAGAMDAGAMARHLHVVGSPGHHNAKSGDDSADTSPSPKRLRRGESTPASALGSPGASSTAVSMEGAAESAQAARMHVALLKLAVTAGFTSFPECFQNAEFQELLRYCCSKACSDQVVLDPARLALAVADHDFVQASARQLADTQLDRVKEGMLNSMIKGGLTLSITCWTTLDLQQLVAFNVVNSNGDAHCVQVVDMGPPPMYSSTALAVKIEEVLAKLQESNISVMGVVADSIVALNAARRVAHALRHRRSLLVVPCVFRLLSVLAGSLLTHDDYVETVGLVVEATSYFTDSELLSALEATAADNGERGPLHPMVLPNRENWFSFLEAIDVLLHHRAAITALCEEESTIVPSALKLIVLGNENNADQGTGVSDSGTAEPSAAFWNKLEDLSLLLAPLKETFAVVFQQPQPQPPQPSQQQSSTQQHQHQKHRVPSEFAYSSLLSPAHGLTLAHLMYQFGRMAQQYADLHDTRHSVMARMMQERVNVMWQRYDLPVMVLSYVFNFHLDTAFLNMEEEPSLQWSAATDYFKLCFERWFCGYDTPHTAVDDLTAPAAPQTTVTTTATVAAESATPAPDLVVSTGSSTDAAAADSNVASGAAVTSSAPTTITHERAAEILDTFKTSQFPFDAETTSDYADVSSFYSFVSESFPEICALCCRMYAISLLTANVSRIVRGIGFVPSIAQTTKPPEAVELLLHFGFASNLKKSTTDASEHDLLRPFESALEYHPQELLWTATAWTDFAEEWQALITQELEMDDFNGLTEPLLDVNPAFHAKLALERVFRQHLPSLVDSAPDALTIDSSALSSAHEAAANEHDGVLSVVM